MLDVPFDLDMRRVSRAIRTAEVLSIFFPWFGQALVVDARSDRFTPPAVFADDMTGSVEERIRGLDRRRPSLGRPARLTALPWPAGVTSFVEAGLYAQVIRRCRALGHADLEGDCARALAALSAAEHRMKLAYIRGDHCRTLYQNR